MILCQPTGWQEVCSHWFLAAAEELQSAGQPVVQPVQPGRLLQPGRRPGRSACRFVTWLRTEMNPVPKPVVRSRWTFTLGTTLLPTRLFAWRSSTVCAAASASRLMCASCSMRSEGSWCSVCPYFICLSKKSTGTSLQLQSLFNSNSVFFFFFSGLLRRSSSQLSAGERHHADPLHTGALARLDDWPAFKVIRTHS